MANFPDIIKIAYIFIKKTFKDSNQGKRIRIYVLKCNLNLYFLVHQNLVIYGEKMLMSAEIKGFYHVIYVVFGSSLDKV